MKFTLRKNGTKMTTLRVEQHIGRWYILAVLIHHCDLDKRITKKDIDKQIRLTLECYGTDWANYYYEQYDEEDFERDKKKADKILDKLFPELIEDKE